MRIKSIHLQNKKEINESLSCENMCIDIGSFSKKKCSEIISLGNFAVFDNHFCYFGDDFIEGKALDSRIGCSIRINHYEPSNHLIWVRNNVLIKSIFPSFLTRGTFLLISGLIVYILTLKLGFEHKEYNFNDPRKSGLHAFAAVFISIFLITLIIFFISYTGKSNTDTQISITYNFSIVLSNALLYLIIISPILLTKKFFKQLWASTGVSRHNLKKSIGTGTISGIIFIILSLFYMNINVNKVITHLNIGHFWALLNCAVIGFSEEFMFRGYLQTRLIAWMGKNKGWMAASILMALMHLPQRIFIGKMTLTETLTSMFGLVFFSLFLGYMMIKTENVTAPSIFHALYDWGYTLV
nr:CPBP family glutamic-type intramembrane protease [Clostridium luticellarii]